MCPKTSLTLEPAACVYSLFQHPAGMQFREQKNLKPRTSVVEVKLLWLSHTAEVLLLDSVLQMTFGCEELDIVTCPK